MNTKVNKAYFLIPVLYIAVIIFLLYMQFSGSSSFSAEISGISISGEKQSGAPGRNDAITELSVRTSGLHFSFGEENPALVFTQDGLTHSTVPQDYRVTASGIDIRLSKGLIVSFYRTQNESSLHISVTAEDPESIKYINLPVIGEEASISAIDGVPVLSIKSETLGNFFLALPDSGSLSEEGESIVIYPESEGASELVLERTAGSGIDAFTYWINGGAELITAEALQVRINNFISMASDSLMNERYNSTRGTWTLGSGISGFEEEALVMAAAENIGKSTYRNIKSKLDQAAASHSRELSIFSSSLFGNIVNEGWAYEQGLEEKTLELTKKSSSNDYSIFSDEDLIAAVLTEKSEELIRQISAMILIAQEENPTLDDTIAMLSFYIEIAKIYPEIADQFTDVRTLIEPVLLPSVRVLDDRLYISESSNEASIMQTIAAGVLLSDDLLSGLNENYSSIGRELLHSALLLTDDSGIMPETITAVEGSDAVQEGVLTPEKVYPLLTDNPYYPASDYFYEETGEKMSVLNQAETFNIEKTDFGYRMNFDFPAGLTHTFAVRNIKPFYQMQLLGYRWNPDHRFLTYSSGWWYDKQHNTLFVKIKHRMKTEEILIYTEQPPAPPAEPVSAADEEPASTMTETTSELNGGL